MRISFILPGTNLSGGSRVIAIYVARLRQRGHTVNVVAPGPGAPSLKQRALGIARGLRQQSAPTFFDDVPHHVLESARPVVDHDIPDADVVLATFWVTAPWVASLAPSKGRKAFFVQGYETSPGHESPAMDAAWRLPLEKIVVSRHLAEFARHRFGQSVAAIVPNSIDLSEFYAPPRDKQAVPTIGLLYHRLDWKGVDVSVAALHRLKTDVPKLRIVSFGSESVQSDVPLPEGTEFHLRPTPGSIKDLYAQCDVWLCGSRREGFGLTLLEAMACRCPVVSTKVGAATDIIEDGVNGFLCEIEDVGNLAERSRTILQLTNSSWRSMSERAYSAARGWSWDDATSLMEQTLQKIASR